VLQRRILLLYQVSKRETPLVVIVLLRDSMGIEVHHLILEMSLVVRIQDQIVLLVVGELGFGGVIHSLRDLWGLDKVELDWLPFPLQAEGYRSGFWIRTRVI
jgi:hypothetical protein